MRERRDGLLVVAALDILLTAPAPTAIFQTGEAATLVVRPEMIELTDDDATRPASHAPGIVRRASYLGNIIEYDVEVGGQLLSLIERDPRRTEIHPEGRTVWVRFLEDCLYVLPK